uniref:Putative inorganic phosphate cotransporter n=1 Tax=Lygus hesperus TaxID=30085 RepID=A0A146LJW8_LYGHE
MAAATDAPKPAKTIGERHKQACIMFLGLVVAYMQRVNVSVGIVAMTDPTASSNPDIPTVNYTTSEKGMISSMFFYGYLISGIPAGILADKFGPVKLVAIIGGILCGIGTISIPFAVTHMGFWTVSILRILQGLGQGFFYPCLNTHMAKWAIPQERSQFTWLWTGSQLGTIIMLVSGGELAEGASGWPAIFYYSGILSITWGVFCLVFGADSPSKHKYITEIERRYIESNLPPVKKDGESTKIPWMSLVSSVPFLTLAFNFICQNWGFFTLLTLTPTYIHGVYGFSIKDNGFLSAIPYIGMLFGGFLLSALADRMSRRFSTNFIRKLFNSIGLYGAAAPLFALSTFHTNATGAMVLLSLATTFNAGIFNGIQCNHLDLAPNLAGILMGITNAMSNIASITAPQWAGFIVKDESSGEQWQIVFLVSAAIYVMGNTAFLIFGSTTIQRWNDPNFLSAEPSISGAPPICEEDGIKT